MGFLGFSKGILSVRWLNVIVEEFAHQADRILLGIVFLPRCYLVAVWIGEASS